MDFQLQGLRKNKVEIPEAPELDVADARHQAMMDAIAPYAKKVQQSNLTPVYINYKTRKTKLALVMAPEWAPNMPPFNLARLSGIAKSAGYETHIFDINVRAYNAFEKDWWPNKKIDFRLWDPGGVWRWGDGNFYFKYIHPLTQPLFEEAIEEILAVNPDVIGFTQYYASEQPTNWIAAEIKRRAPHIKLAVGGSNVQKDWFYAAPCYDYIVVGEGEQAILEILNEVEEGRTTEGQKFIKQPEDQRININNLPMPDYESIDFSQYKVPNGVNSEISRGCTAKCTFCEETHFWKYRQRQAVDLIQEVEWLYYNKGTDVIWFIDSLVNGNLKELRAFCKAVDAKKLPIHWTGYARCDGRMDLEYFKDLKAGGCIILNYGIESGSQKVLDAMDKGVTIAEIEQNFKDGKEVGVWAATNWIVGFPTEEPQDFADTMTLLWRIRNMNMNNVGAGTGFGLGPETIVGQNPGKFNISDFFYLDHWITKDFKFGGSHMLTRLKSFYIFLDKTIEKTDFKFGYPVRHKLAKDHYQITFDDPNYWNDEVDYEKFDYEIIKPNINVFADSLVNEIWPLFRMLWKTRGGFEATIKFHPDIDLIEFGTQYGPAIYYATYKFKINQAGEWTADFEYKFDQVKLPPFKGEIHRCGPFFFNDFSRYKSNSAKRARHLAKPEWSLESGRDDIEFWDRLQEEYRLNKLTDFSFDYRYNGSGDWGDFKKYSVEVSNKSAIAIPERQSVFSVSLKDIKRKPKE